MPARARARTPARAPRRPGRPRNARDPGDPRLGHAGTAVELRVAMDLAALRRHAPSAVDARHILLSRTTERCVRHRRRRLLRAARANVAGVGASPPGIRAGASRPRIALRALAHGAPRERDRPRLARLPTRRERGGSDREPPRLRGVDPRAARDPRGARSAMGRGDAHRVAPRGCVGSVLSARRARRAPRRARRGSRRHPPRDRRLSGGRP